MFCTKQQTWLNSGFGVFGLPVGAADEIPEGPDRAKVVTGAEFGVVEADNGAIGAFFEGADAGPD